MSLKISFAAIAGKAGDRQHEIDTQVIGGQREREVFVPACIPALGHSGGGKSARAIRREDTDFKMVFLKQRMIGPHFFLRPLSVLK